MPDYDKVDEVQVENAAESANAKAGSDIDDVGVLARLSADELKLRERKLLRKLDARMILTLLLVGVHPTRHIDSDNPVCRFIW
jgi:hypothetical protein